MHRRRAAPGRPGIQPGPLYTELERTRTAAGGVAVLVRIRGGRLFRLEVAANAATSENIAALVAQIAADWPGYPPSNIERENPYG